MAYFSRLTDIVTCNLSAILAEADDPKRALDEILTEMQQGIAGAQRSMKTSVENEARLRDEVEEQRQQIETWVNKAREQLTAGDEDQARQSLMRKHEIEHLIAGLDQQLKAATSTREHLTTMFHALEARYADAQRRRTALESGGSVESTESATATARPSSESVSKPARATDVIDLELDSLKKELEQQREQSE